MSHSLNSLKGVIKGIIYGTTIGVIKGDTRSLDSGSYNIFPHPLRSSSKFAWRAQQGRHALTRIPKTC